MSQGSCCSWVTGLKIGLYGVIAIGMVGAGALAIAPDETYDFLNKVTGGALGDASDGDEKTCSQKTSGDGESSCCQSGAQLASTETGGCCSATKTTTPACCSAGKTGAACCSKGPSVVELITDQTAEREPVMAPRPVGLE